jgi:D-alanyl-lipoteichoic acid acyltransferase DltB (MBOAT superfamily)
VYFAFQIYGDFSGYSDIAIGTARLFGLDLMKNFNYPYFSRDIAEFWRRWHISLSTWFRDYLYIPLGGSKGSLSKKIRNIFVIFLVSGFWHGANWTFVFWGFLNAIFFIPLFLSKRNRRYLDQVANNRLLPSIREFTQIIFTFILSTFAWIFFRADSFKMAITYIKGILNFDFDFGFKYLSIDRYAFEILPLIGFFVLIEWFSRHNETPIFGKMKYIKTLVILILIATLGVFSNHSEFIYFQF